MDKRELAVSYFNKGYNCSQAVLSVFCEELGLEKEMAFKVATAFGGGMRSGEVCGAVTGALMVIGLKHGFTDEKDVETKQKAYALAKEFQERFQAVNKSVICKEILEYDLSKEEEMAILVEKGLFMTVCPKMVMDAVRILEEML